MVYYSRYLKHADNLVHKLRRVL